MGRALIVSAGANSNEYIAARLSEMGYSRPVIIPSGAEARRRMSESDFELIVVNAPLPDEFGHELCITAVEQTDAGVVFLSVFLFSSFSGELPRCRLRIGAAFPVRLSLCERSFSMSAPLHLYLHVPFCVRRCTFCNQKIYPATPETCKAYANALLAELEATAPDFSGDPVQTVYWGGGSPTALSQDDFARIMRRIRELFSLAADTEVTVEALPNRVDASWMVAFQNTGVNRLVLGLATARIPELERIGSANNMPSSETSLILPQLFHLPGYEATLLYGIPGQTAANFATSLRFAVKYKVSALRLDPLTLPKGVEETVCRDEVPAMLDYAARHLTEKGYHEYLPGRWAKPGQECRDLLARQSTENYLSFGPGTTTRVDGDLSRTTENIAVYTLHPQEPELLYKPVTGA